MRTTTLQQAAKQIVSLLKDNFVKAEVVMGRQEKNNLLILVGPSDRLAGPAPWLTLNWTT